MKFILALKQLVLYPKYKINSQTVEQQRNYAYLSIAFWGLVVWTYRSYLALPSKK